MTFAQVLLLIVYYAMLAVVGDRDALPGAARRSATTGGRGDGRDAARRASTTEPVVTVQLPVFNERYVVERLLESVCALDWPRDRLEVQLLDD